MYDNLYFRQDALLEAVAARRAAAQQGAHTTETKKQSPNTGARFNNTLHNTMYDD